MRPYLALLVLLAAAVLPGCSASGPRREVIIGLDQALAESSARPTIQVDVVGLNDAERKLWDAKNLSEYWLPGSPARAAMGDRLIPIRYGREFSQPVSISVDDKVWKAWERAGAKWVYIVANLPGGVADKPGAGDPRRLAISLTSKEWAADAPLRVQVRRDAVVFTTPRAQAVPGKPIN